MKVVGFAGFSGSGKTTLVERLIPALKMRGLRVSVIKHAHHNFDIDHPGKDTWRHREAGAFEVIAASDRRLALMREFEQPGRVSVHHLLGELWHGVDWVLVEGFKDSSLLKMEVWRAEAGKPARYPHDEFMVAIATDSPDRIGGTHALGDQARHLPQHLVARSVAVLVVRLLEAVEVDDGHRHRRAVALAVGRGAAQLPQEPAPVQHAGELVHVGELLELADA